MLNIFKKQYGMGVVGQGGKIILFTLPALIAAIMADTYAHSIAALPESVSFLHTVGYVWLAPGLVYWATAVIQLLVGFSKGKLVTTGAYGIARNPIYSSVTFFILPAASLITLTWVYLVVAAFLFTGVMIFIGVEERQLTSAFGKAYVEYMGKVDRLVPFKKPTIRTTPRPQVLQR
jgi:protein-S-isoprenylcysteine O-methyltransferase Ste14